MTAAAITIVATEALAGVSAAGYRRSVTADRTLFYFSPLCASSEAPDIAQPLQRLRRPPTRPGPAGQL